MNLLLKEKDGTNKTIMRIDKNVKKTFNLLTELNQKFANTPALVNAKDSGLFKIDVNKDKKEEFPEMIVDYHNDGRLTKYISDNVKCIYKKKNKNEQSIWTSDVSRNNFIIKINVDNSHSIWATDKNGITTCASIIEPYIKFILDEVMSHGASLNNCENIKQIHKENEYREKALKFREDVLNQKIKSKVIQYLSPEFQYEIDSVK